MHQPLRADGTFATVTVVGSNSATHAWTCGVGAAQLVTLDPWASQDPLFSAGLSTAMTSPASPRASSQTSPPCPTCEYLPLCRAQGWTQAWETFKNHGAEPQVLWGLSCLLSSLGQYLGQCLCGSVVPCLPSLCSAPRSRSAAEPPSAAGMALRSLLEVVWGPPLPSTQGLLTCRSSHTRCWHGCGLVGAALTHASVS